MIIIFCVLLSVINFYFLVKILSEKPHQKDIQDFQTQTERLMVEFNRITTRNIDLLDSRIEELNHKIRQSQKTEALLKELFEEAQKIEHLSSIIPKLSPDRRSSVSAVSDDVLPTLEDGHSSVSTDTIDETPSNNVIEITEDENQRSWSPVLNVSDDNIVDDIVEVKDSENIIDVYLNDNPSFEELISISKPSPDRRSSVSTVSDDILPTLEDGHSSVSTDTIDETPSNNVIEITEDENQQSWSDGQPSDSLFEGVSVDKIKKHRKKSKNSQELLKKYIQENKTKEELLEMGYNINEINLMSLSLAPNLVTPDLVSVLEKTPE